MLLLNYEQVMPVQSVFKGIGADWREGPSHNPLVAGSSPALQVVLYDVG